MQKKNDDLTHLFQSRLSDAELTVRDGFWEELEQDIPIALHQHRRLVFYRISAVASVALVLVTTFACIWYFSPKEEMEQAFKKVAMSGGGQMDGDAVRINPLPISAKPILNHPSSGALATVTSHSDSEDSVSITVSMSFSFSSSSTRPFKRQWEQIQKSVNALWTAHSESDVNEPMNEEGVEKAVAMADHKVKKQRWILKVQGGVALPKNSANQDMPISLGVGLERKLNDRFGIETGLMYSNLRSAEQQLHYIGVPVKVNFTVAKSKKMEWYLSAGGQADKCIVGAPDNDFHHEPIQLSVMAGFGLNYKINDRLAVFVEPGVTHSFDTDSKLATIRTERPTNFNLLCGVRMTY